jgi:transposase-like protein
MERGQRIEVDDHARSATATGKSLQVGGPELLTFFTFPQAQWKTVRTTNTIERLTRSSAGA